MWLAHFSSFFKMDNAKDVFKILIKKVYIKYFT
jgi:hypothetical protein